jgi:hypothetical protein
MGKILLAGKIEGFLPLLAQFPSHFHPFAEVFCGMVGLLPNRNLARTTLSLIAHWQYRGDFGNKYNGRK